MPVCGLCWTPLTLVYEPSQGCMVDAGTGQRHRCDPALVEIPRAVLCGRCEGLITIRPEGRYNPDGSRHACVPTSTRP